MFTIGELARRTGLPVKTIRFYSDEGLLPPTSRTHSGYRLYDTTAMARLELVRTLRELGIGLSDVERVLAEQTAIPALARRHLDALDAQIHQLTLRRAVLRAVVKRESEPEEVRIMNKLASMSDEQRRNLLDDFWTEVTEGLNVDPELYERMRSAKPDLPDDPTPEQLESWIELAELVQDQDFRRLIRGMGEAQAARRDASQDIDPHSAAQRESWVEWSGRAQEQLDAGVAPDSPEGRALAADIAQTSAVAGDDPASPAYRNRLAEQIAAGNDHRAERYWQLLGIINGWPPFPSQHAAAQWIIDAVRASAS